MQENGKQIAAFDYHVDGQIASATHGDKSENFLWDGLALIHRGETSYINEPYVTGGNPVLSSKDGVMFNDMLGTTLGIKSADAFSPVSMTAFGETSDRSAMFTGKPYIGELGYAFLFRNYRADQGKWQTSDPLGYPDGWNNLAYCNNNVTDKIDVYGLSTFDDYGENLTKLSAVDYDFVRHYYMGNGNRTLESFGLQSAMESEVISQGIIERFTNQTDAGARGLANLYQYNGSFSNSFTNSYNFIDVAYSLGSGVLSGSFVGNMTTYLIDDNPRILAYSWSGVVTLNFSDAFTDPLSIIQLLYGSSNDPNAPSWLVSIANLGGTPYNITGTWQISISGRGIIE